MHSTKNINEWSSLCTNRSGFYFLILFSHVYTTTLEIYTSYLLNPLSDMSHIIDKCGYHKGPVFTLLLIDNPGFQFGFATCPLFIVPCQAVCDVHIQLINSRWLVKISNRNSKLHSSVVVLIKHCR